MKTTFLLVGLAVLPLLAGCNRAESAPESGTETAQAVAPAQPASETKPIAPAATNALSAVEPPAVRVVNTNLTLPDTVKLSPAAAEIAKLARAGVDPSVMQSYIAGSVNTYQLTAEEIVYLNDLGVASDVMSAMIQHDQQIREASLQGAMAATPATPAPGGSVWSNEQAANTANVWQETAAAPAPAASEVENTVPPPPVEERPAEVTVNYFYDSLAPYGTWVDVDGYGRCWRPTVVASTPGWRPYVNGGRWVWTDSGWYWYSDYSWGWAPFHYGRWFSHTRLGWCWVPGTVWGPSWVSWRYNDGYCGWAPLPPAACYYPRYGFSYYGRSCGVGFSFGLTWDHFTFVSYNGFYGRNYDRYCAPRYQAAQIYNNSTVINNIIVGDNNTIINQGISPDRITRVTRSEIPRATVSELAGGPGRGGRQETLAPNGTSLAVVRHEVPGGRPPTRVSSNPAPAVEPITTPAPVLPEPTRTVRGETGRPGGSPTTAQNTPGSGETRGGSSVPSASSAAVSTSRGDRGPTASTSAPTRPGVTRTPGALHIQGNPNPPVTAQAAGESATRSATASATTTQPNHAATPWLNNSPSRTGRSGGSTWQSSANNSAPTVNSPSSGGRLETPTQVYQPGGGRPSAPTASAASQHSRSVSSPRVITIPAPPVRSSPSPATPWSQDTRPGTRNYENFNNNNSYGSAAPARSTPRYSAPAQSSSPANLSPAPVTRIERPTPEPRYAAPAPAAPARVSAPPPASPGGGRPSAPSSPPPSRGNGGSSGNNPAPSRPGGR